MGISWVVLVCLGTSGSIWAQASAAGQAAGKAGSGPVPTHYDVISVRPNNSGSGHWGFEDGDGGFVATNVTLNQILFSALELQPEEITGLPGWALSTHFDIQAKVLDVDSKVMKHLTDEQDRALLLSILEDRFGFKSHFETKMLPVYDLVVAKGGLLIKPVPEAPPAEGADPDAHSGGIEIDNNTMIVTTATMDRVAQSLIRQVGRTVIEKTGLAGQYSFTLKFTPEGQLSGAEAGQPDAPPSIDVALERQVGLKLESGKGPVRTLVVEHVEQPTQN